jgi:hypothetical protein
MIAAKNLQPTKNHYDMTVSGEICMIKDNNMFSLPNQVKKNNIKNRVYYEPDEEFYNSITTEELRKRVLTDVHKWYTEINENNCNPKSTTVS